MFTYYIKYTYDYIPHRDRWLNKLYFNISSSNKKQCLAIDTKDVNNLGPARFKLKLTITMNRFAIITVTKKTKGLIVFWS